MSAGKVMVKECAADDCYNTVKHLTLNTYSDYCIFHQDMAGICLSCLYDQEYCDCK